ncbi:hypothetical protein [Bradyrhizobium ottawaense]|uniref:hypothetical protein n=1 Tax=Bradyrhizobium ottawaense TaxID=931866 RepID=UPI0030F3B1A0
MPVIQIDAEKAERIIAQALRDEGGLFPGKANSVAAEIRRRLTASEGTPVAPWAAGCKVIKPRPPTDSDFTKAVGEKIADVNDRVAAVLWRLVYDRGTDLPGAVADPAYWLR